MVFGFLMPGLRIQLPQFLAFEEKAEVGKHQQKLALGSDLELYCMRSFIRVLSAQIRSQNWGD